MEAELGSVAGPRVLHLQGHIGDDSIALAQRGASEVVGIDFSAAVISAARDLARDVGVTNARFLEADLYAVPEVLAEQASSFDLVFTTWGTITWLPDLEGWARVVAQALRPGGSLNFVDPHPVAMVFDGLADSTDAEARPR